MEYFRSVNQDGLVELIQNTKKQLFLSMPAIHKELGDAICRLAESPNYENGKTAIHILVDFDPQTFRQGYGVFEAFEKLRSKGIDIRNLPDNRVSFVISDDMAYFLFIESRSLIPAGKQTLNAVKADPVSVVRLKKYFFSGSIEIDFEDELSNAIIEESKLLQDANELVSPHTAGSTKLTEDRIKQVDEDLKKNPPLNPDFKRLVEFYSNKFQYVKLKFEGAGMESLRISLPADALPVKDAYLRRRLETKLKLFDEDESKRALKPFNDLRKIVDQIRKQFLFKIKTRDESLLDKTRKEDFLTDIDEVKSRIQLAYSISERKIQEQLNASRMRLEEDLEDLLKANPEALKTNELPLWDSEKENIPELARQQSKKIVSDINWPDSKSLLKKIKLDIQFSDITYEDLKSATFLMEIKRAGLIDKADVKELANFGMGIETR